MGERVVGERSLGSDASADDLGHDVRVGDVDPLERGHDGQLGAAERRRDRRQPDVIPALGRDLVEVPPQGSEGALTAGRGVVGLGRGALAVPWPPHRRFESGIPQSIGKLATDRDRDLHEIHAGVEGPTSRAQRRLDVRIGKGHADPRPRRVAEDVEQLAPRGAVGVDPVDGGRRQAPGLLLGDRPPVRFAEELRLHPEIDRPRRDVEREALRLEVVFHERHRERQEQAAAQAAAAAGEVAVHDRPGERPSRGVEAADTAQAQQRPLAADRRRRPSARGPGAGQRLGSLGEPIERPERRGCSRHRAFSCRSVRRVSCVDSALTRPPRDSPAPVHHADRGRREGLSMALGAPGLCNQLADALGEPADVERLALEVVAAGVESLAPNLGLD